MFALLLTVMGACSNAEPCSGDTPYGCSADHSDLLQTKVKVSNVEPEAKVNMDLDEEPIMQLTQDGKDNVSQPSSHDLLPFGAGERCMNWCKWYAVATSNPPYHGCSKWNCKYCESCYYTTPFGELVTPPGLPFGGGQGCGKWCKWTAVATSNPPYNGCSDQFCNKCQSCYEMPPEYPSAIFKCQMAQTLTSGKNASLYDQIANEIKLQYASKTMQSEKQSYAACIVRTAGHDLMDFRYDQNGIATGDSDGCINFKDEDNAGLPGCLVSNGFSEAYAKFCDKVSLGDFLVLAAEISMVSSAVPTVQRHLAAPETPYDLEAALRDAFTFGRPTVAECSEHNNLMPDAEEGCYDLKRVFVDHVYLDKEKKTSWKMTAAISGVHTLGGAHVENSGYNGTWTQDPWVFNNAYYLRILDQGWMPQRKVANNAKKNQWIVSDKVRTPEDEKQMMLNTDLCMIFDNSLDSVNCDRCVLNSPQFISLGAGPEKNAVYRFCKDIRGKGHFLNAKEKMCCTWTRPDKMMTTSQWHRNTDPTSDEMSFPLPALYDNKFDDNHHCGVNFTSGSNSPFFKHCCQRLYDDPSYTGPTNTLGFCDYQGNIEGVGWRWIQKFAYNENIWLKQFVKAWKVATENSIHFVHASDAAAASKAHFQKSRDNCGACREKDLDGAEAEDENEALKQEDTYTKSFWDERKKTWPMWTQASDGVDPPANLARDDVVTKLRAFLVGRNLDITWMDGMIEDITGETCRR